MKSFLLTGLFFLFCFALDAQEVLDLKGEVDFPWINAYSAYGLEPELAQKAIASYERTYRKAKRKKELNRELRLYALVKEHQLLYAPYVSVRNEEGKLLIVYMDSVSYSKTLVWNYNSEDLTRNQQFLFFEAKGKLLGENAYLLTEFIQMKEVTDPSRSKALSKFAMDVYRK